jgi:SAM-dependent methyltransferase
MVEEFVHPYTKMPLEEDSEGNLFCLEGNQRVVFKCYDDCFDFVTADLEIKEKREVYDEHYTNYPVEELTAADIAEFWQDDTLPWYETILRSLGSLEGRKVLLLGNGMSYKEFYFLRLGANVVFTDLSLVAVKRAQAVFRKSELGKMHRSQIEFHAVNAMHLPFRNESFDVIYGKKFVGFMDDLPGFFSEVARCLKPGGICRFTDDAYSPAYQIFRGMWHPIKAHILWKSMSALDRIRHGNSPKGDFGYKEESLTPLIERCGFSKLVFIREYFFLRLIGLFWGKMVRFDSKKIR